MTNVTIRNFREEDAEYVAPLIHQLTKNVVDPDGLIGRLEDLAHTACECVCLVAEDGLATVGFAQLIWYQIPSKGMMGWIEEVVVDEKHRGRGIAKQLVEELLARAENLGLAQVKLTASLDPAARRVYEKAGFVVKDETLMIKKYY